MSKHSSMDQRNRKTLFLRFLAINALWESIYSKLLQYSILILSSIQCVGLLAGSVLGLLLDSQDDIPFENAWRIVLLMSGKDTIRDEPSENMLFVVHILSWIYYSVILFLFAFAAKNHFQGKERSLNTQNWTIFLYQFHLAFGFAFTVTPLMDVLINSQAKATLANNLNTTEYVMSLTNIILIILSYIFGGFAAFFCYDPFPTANILACHSTSFQALTFLYKAISIPLACLAYNSEGYLWIFISFSIVFLALRHYQLVNTVPYYNYNTMKVAVALSSICVFTSLLSVLLTILKDYASLTAQGILFIEVIVNLLAVAFFNGQFERFILPFLDTQNRHLKTENDVLRKLLALQYVIKDSRISIRTGDLQGHNELYFWGLYKYRIKLGLDNLESEINSKTNAFQTDKEDDVMIHISSMHKLIQTYLEEIVQNGKFTNKILQIIINSLLETNENPLTSILYLSRFSKSSIFDRLIIDNLSQRAQQKVHNILKYRAALNGIDIEGLVHAEETSGYFLNALHSSAKDYIDLWTYYKDKEAKIQNLGLKSVQVEKGYEQVQCFWKHRISENKYLEHSLAKPYAIYLTLVRNRPLAGHKILIRHTKTVNHKIFKKKNDFLSDEASKRVIIQAYMSTEKLGKVHDVSSQIVQVLGWSKEDIIGRNINSIMPVFMREIHDKILQEHLEKFKKSSVSSLRMKKSFESFVIDKAGFILPCEISLSIYPYIQGELKYVAVLKVKEMKQGLILLSQDGGIHGINRYINKRLDLMQGRLNNIKNICKDYAQLENFLNNQSIQYPGTKSLEAGSPVTIAKSHTTITQNIFDDTKARKLCNNDCQIDLELRGKQTKFEFFNSYSAHISCQNILKHSFYVLKLDTKDTESSDSDSSSLRVGIQEILSDNMEEIPKEKIFKEETVQSPVRSINSAANIFTQGSDAYRNINELGLSSPRDQLLSPKTLTRNNMPTSFNFESPSKIRLSIPQSLNIKDKIQEQQNHPTVEKGFMDNHEDESRSASASEKFDMKLERAIERIPKDTNLSLLKYIGIFFIIIVPFTVLMLQTQNNSISSTVDVNMDIISQTYLILAQVLEINKAARVIIFFSEGLIGPAKYSSMNVTLVISPALLHFAPILVSLTSQVRDSLDLIDPDLRAKAHSYKIPVYQRDDNGVLVLVQSYNIFDFLSEFTARTYRLGHAKYNDTNQMNPDVNWIVDNSLNDFLLVGEQIGPLFIEDCQIKLNSQRNVVTPIAPVMSCIGLIILIILYKLIKSFVTKRDRLLGILMRLNARQIEDHIRKVQIFAKDLEKGYFDTDKNTYDDDNSKFMKLMNNIDNNNNNNATRKFIRLEGINNIFILHYLGAILFVLIILSIFAFHIIIIDSQKNVVLRKINLMAESNSYLYQFLLLSTLVPEYVRTNTTDTIRNIPIDQEIDGLYANLTHAQDFFGSTLLEDDNGFISNKTLYDLVSGNLCELFPSNARVNAMCLNGNGGSLTKGVIGMNSLILSVVQSSISEFDYSSRNFTEMYNIINDPLFTLMEYADLYYNYQAYSSIYDIIKSKINEDIDGFQKWYKLLNIIFSVCCISVGLSLWVYMMRKLEIEMEKWMKLIRQIPRDILMNNKFLKAHLIETSQAISVKS